MEKEEVKGMLVDTFCSVCPAPLALFCWEVLQCLLLPMGSVISHVPLPLAIVDWSEGGA